MRDVMRSLNTVVFLTACHHAEAPEQAPFGAQTTGGSPTIIDVSTLTTRWVGAGGWALNGAGPVGDLNNDGVTDAIAQAFRRTESGDEYRIYIVYGPLRDSKTFPGDEDASIAGWGFQNAGDATGDGILDFDLANWDETTLVPGPFEGAVDVPGTAIPLGGAGMLDFNGDGILDKYIMGESWNEDDVRLTWGPSSRWGGPPDVVVAPQCGSFDESDWLWEQPRVWPDVTGDGVRELWVAGYGPFRPCGGYLLPLPESGEVDPEAIPNVARGVAPFEVISDQTGDGAPDLYLSVQRRILGAPVTFVDGQPTSSTELAVDRNLFFAFPQTFDFDDDGIADFLGIDRGFDRDEPMAEPAGPSYLLIASGGEALATALASQDSGDTVWKLVGSSAGGVFLEDGIASAFTQGSDGFTLVDLGPATQLD